MLRTSKRERPVKSRRRTSQPRHGIVGIHAYQLVVSGRKGHRVHLSDSVASDIHGPVRALKRELSGARSIYLKDGPSTVVRIYGTPESRSGLANDNERSTLAIPGYVVGNWSSFPTKDVIPPSDAEEMDFHPRRGGSAVSDFAEGEFTYTYRGRELNQRPGKIAQMTLTPTPDPVSLQQEYGFRTESQMELGNEPRHYDSHDLLSSASVPSKWGDPTGPVSSSRATYGPRVSPSFRPGVCRRAGSCSESPFTVPRPFPCRRRPSP